MKEKLKRLLCHPAVILFCGFVLIFSFADSRVNNRERSELENRELAQKPEMTRSNLLASEDKKKFSYLYETYVNDQFLERDRWISLKSRTEALLLKTENNGIIYGKDGTMYQKSGAGYGDDRALGGSYQQQDTICAVCGRSAVF
ncbi:MAG: hypothetical protein RSF90_03315 [Pygmaiobacter sp.]